MQTSEPVSNVVPFQRRSDDAWNEIEQREYLIVLHDYLEAALYRQKANGTTRVTLCIDDILILCELIEKRVGIEHFSSDVDDIG
jgi:hypothetical protein